MRGTPRPRATAAPGLPVRVLGTGMYLPERIVTNDEIARTCGRDARWLEEHVGFVERRWARPDEATSDLAAAAARSALASASLAADRVDLLVCATCTPDHLFPSTAGLVAARLGATRAAAFDVQAGCAGFVHAFALAAQSIALSLAERAVVVGADVMSRFVDRTDPATAAIFGDGAGAIVLGPSEDGAGVVAMSFGSDGGGAGLLALPAGGSRRALSTGPDPADAFLRMQGPALYRSAVRHAVDAVTDVLEVGGLRPGDIDLVVPHQSSRRLIAAIADRCRFPEERVVTDLDRSANTSAASIPIAYDGALRAGRIPEAGRVLLLGFGAGLTWGATVLKT